MLKIILIPFLISCFFTGENSQMKITVNNGVYSLIKNNLELKVDANYGGRIISFKLNGYDFLVSEKENNDSFGSTLWPSPQSMWGWPPVKILDSNPYKSKHNDFNVEMESDNDPLTGFSISKILSDAKNENGFTLEFKITNRTDKEKSAAPWLISRVRKGGILFFPMGKGEQMKKFFPLAETQTKDGIVWYQTHKGESLKTHLLNIADGSEGWLAYAIDGRLFIKKFKDNEPDKFAPGEAEVLFYTSSDHDYIEIETQGAYEKLGEGKNLDWKIEWLASEIPSEIKCEIGSKNLVDFVRKIIR
jgi:hypothetical protein